MTGGPPTGYLKSPPVLSITNPLILFRRDGPVAELVDARDLKSRALTGVPVRFRPGPPVFARTEARYDLAGLRGAKCTESGRVKVNCIPDAPRVLF